MSAEFTGETEITPEELYHFSQGTSRLQQLLLNLVLLGVIGIVGWLILPPVLKYFGILATGATDLADAFRPEVPDGYTLVPGAAMFKFAIAFAIVTFLVLKLMFYFGLKPLGKTVFRRTSQKLDAVNNAIAGSVRYEIDQYGLEYNIVSSEARNKYKLYWRNFTHAEYSPEIIRLYKDKKQTAFILMRAFPGKEKWVGQFVERVISKHLE